MQHLDIHNVESMQLGKISCIDTKQGPFFYRYIEIMDKDGNMVQLCFYSTISKALEIVEEQNDKNIML